MGHLWDRDVVEDLERSWHGGGASLVLDMAEGKEGCTVWVEIFFSLLFRRRGRKFRRKVKTPNSKGQLSLGYEITRSDKTFKGRTMFGDRSSNTWSTGEEKGGHYRREQWG